MTTQELLSSAQQFADDVAARPNTGSTAAPLDDLRQMNDLGLMTAPLPAAQGGLGFGTEAGGHRPLMRLLTIIGSADLVLGRLYEGHVNGLLLIAAYGTQQQLECAANDARAGRLFGVWNTGSPAALRLNGGPEDYTFNGGKTFASGAAFVQRPIVTAELDGGGWQMTVPHMELPAIADALKVDRSFWHPFGMESSESFGIDFTGATLDRRRLIGAPGDFYRDPLFRGGAIRFAAVHAGAVLRLHRMFVEWLEMTHRADDPYQIARLGEIALDAQQAVLWIERAAEVAEAALLPDAGKLATERMVECANMTRLAIERLATAVMQRVTAGIGARGLLQPSRFERILRDLTMYLRQPSPDQALADVGRATLRKARLQAGGAANGFWTGPLTDGSLPPEYFQRVYQKSADPWDFETSPYEAEKYRAELASLPQARYGKALEIGCSIGVFTQQLAARCDCLLSVDISDRALAAASARCASLPHVHFKQMRFPEETPDQEFDLIVLSEVGYYWQREELELAATRVAELQRTGAHLLLVHYTPHVPDYPLTGDEVHEAWMARPEWKVIHAERGERYRLELFERCG